MLQSQYEQSFARIVNKKQSTLKQIEARDKLVDQLVVGQLARKHQQKLEKLRRL